MIRQDMLSKILIVLSMMFSVYLATFETTTIVMFPAFLLIFGLVMEMWMEKKEEYVNHIQQPKTWKTIFFYTLGALAGILLTGMFINYSQIFAVTFSMSVVSAISYSFIMGIAEEQFFRGFITDFLLSRIPNNILALVSSAGIFTIYHTARYGAQPESMMYVFAGGFILSFVSWKSRRISPCMLAHAINNVIAVMGVF